MNRWSVKWTLRDSQLPNELERIRGIMPELTESEALMLAKTKDRGFETKPRAIDCINDLMAKPSVVSRIDLFQCDPYRKVESFTLHDPAFYPDMPRQRYSTARRHRMGKVTSKSIARAQAAGDAAMERMRLEAETHFIAGTTAIGGRRFHEMGQYLIQESYDEDGRWHAYFRHTYRNSFATEDLAKEWLRACPPPHLQPDFRPPQTPLETTPMKFTVTDEEDHAPTAEVGSFPDMAMSLPEANRVLKYFSFRSYQREDIARAAMHDGAIIAWDPGLGKTLALFTFFMLKRARRVLIVAPAALHEQIIDEGMKFFGVTVRAIPDQETALRLMREGILPFPGQEDPESPLPDMPEFFITAYNWLGYNGADEWTAEEPNEVIRRRRFLIATKLFGFNRKGGCAVHEFKKNERCPYKILNVSQYASKEEIKAAWQDAARLYDPSAHPDDDEIHLRSAKVNSAYRVLANIPDDKAHNDLFTAELEAVRKDPAHVEAIKRMGEIEMNIGHEQDEIRCVFKPTLCSILKNTFDGVGCDEAVRIKSGTAYQADGVLRMEAKYRLVLTGTPVKNKLPDIFFLASFVTGHSRRATARWPYGNQTSDRAQFAQDFGVWEENLTKQEDAREKGNSIPRGKTDPTIICNVHRLWRILGPVVIRRRKDDVPGCDIVGKTIVPVRVMPGTEQQKVYGYQLLNPPPHKSDLAELGHQLQCLRQSALFPASASLIRPGQPLAHSSQRFTPKSAGIVQLAIDLMKQGEQLVVFSPFQDFAEDLSDRFTRAGIPHLNLDGKVNPLKRGALIKRFKSGEYPILLAGIESMGEGHSLDNASHLVLPSLSWSFDKNAQAVERVHRLTSKKDVTIYVMVTRNTIDERLVAMWQDKGDASDLALDGRLVETQREEIDLGKLLRDAVADFDPDAHTLDETEVEERWGDTLIPGLLSAFATYRELRPVPTETAAPGGKKPQKSHRHAAPVLQATPPAASTPAPASRPFSLLELMRNSNTPRRRPGSTPATAASPPETKPVVELRKVVPFPGRLGAATQTAKKPVVIPAALQ